MRGINIVLLTVIFGLPAGFFLPALCDAKAPYLIAPADTMEISVYGEPNLIRELIVRPDGKVSFPLVGDLDVAGKTTGQVKTIVEKIIREYIPDASVTVILTQIGSLQFYVLGKVARPGTFNMSRSITVLQALAMAGGLTTFANEKQIMIIRHYGDKVIHVLFNYQQVKRGANLEQDIELERGDVVLVP